MSDFYKEFEDSTLDDLNHYLMGAADNGDLEKVQYLLTSTELNCNANIKYQNYWVLKRACTSGNIDLVKYLLTSTELKQHCEINADNDAALCAACDYGHLHIVDYLLTSSELNKHSKINTQQGTTSPLSWACSRGHLDVVKYLLTSPKLKEKSDLHFKDDAPFYEAYCSKNWDILQYFIFDLNIEKTKHIDFCISVYSDSPVENWFRIRESQKELMIELDKKELNNKKKNKL